MESLNSEGIAFHKPLRKRGASGTGNSTGSRKRKSLQLEKLCVDVLRTFEEPAHTIHRRTELYSKCIDNLRDNYDRVQQKFNKDLNERFSKFMKSGLHLLSENQGTLPIGIIESGLSARENSALFDFVEEKLQSLNQECRENIIITRADSASCSSTKAIFQKICSQIIKSIDARKEKENVTPSESKPERKDLHYSLYDVKQLLSGESDYRIAVMIEDVEYFAGGSIMQLLTLIGCAELPVLFIFGATHAHFVNNLIPLNNPSQYMMEKIYSVSSGERLDDLMRRVLFNTFTPFRVSGEIVSYLEHLYKEENFSIEYICNSIALCLRYHYLTAKSAFCSFDNSSSYEETTKQNLLDILNGDLDGQSPRKRVKAKLYEANVDEYLDSSLEDMQNWFTLFQVLSFMNLRLTQNPLGSSYCQMYVSCCQESNSDEENPLSKMLTALCGISKVDFCSILEDCLQFLKGGRNLLGSTLAQKLSSEFQEILDELEKKEKEVQPSEDTIESTQKPIRIKRGKGGLKELQEELKERMRKTGGTSAIYAAKTRFDIYMKQSMKKYLPPLSSLRLSKAYVFADLPQLINTMSPANSLKLHEDLTNPGFSLKCKCCSFLESSSVDISLPDVCILHKLISEHTTKKVDLNLIYRSFLQVMDQIKRKPKVRQEALETSFLVRFRRGIGELQHMGFLKRSKSKPDEITRLSWW